MIISILVLNLLSFSSASASSPYDFFLDRGSRVRDRHVSHLHLDGLRADLFTKMLDAGQLPHFKFLVESGRYSNQVTTVDKSETMKVIESYLTSTLDTQIVGWWQFDRSSFKYRNFWLDPVEVLNYEIGLNFPSTPTIQDVLRQHSQRSTSGFSLARRSVDIEDYSQNFVEGLHGVYHHTYFDQAHETMSGILNLYSRDSKLNRNAKYNHSIIACADESSHLLGVSRPDSRPVSDTFTAPEETDGQACFDLSDEKMFSNKWVQVIAEKMGEFKGQSILFENETIRHGLIEKGQGLGHFTKIERSFLGKVKSFCISLPKLIIRDKIGTEKDWTVGEARMQYVESHYALSMIWLDLQLGRLFKEMRETGITTDGKTQRLRKLDGLKGYLANRKLESTLFENTLFVFHGDHGMVDNKGMMYPNSPEWEFWGRAKESTNDGLIKVLNARLGLNMASKGKDLLGVDDAELPDNVKYPFTNPEWRDAEVSQMIKNSHQWAEGFFTNVIESIKDSAYKKFWYVFIFKDEIIGDKIDDKVGKYREKAIKELTYLHLRGEKAYLEKEKHFLESYYSSNVKLVYGGGARNNAELFIPGTKEGKASWHARPSYEEILNYTPNGKSLIEVLKESKEVGVWFIREENVQLNGVSIPSKMNIHIMDRFDNHGVITVSQKTNGEQLYSYVADPEKDPIRYGKFADGVERTYQEWNDINIQEKFALSNVVAGMGSFLYSNNPAIGDITAVAAQGWNFGDNLGGHGGLTQEEKTTIMIVNGPYVKPGVLKSQDANGKEHQPTLLDVAPTVLNWLGHGESAISDHYKNTFEAQMKQWKTNQVTKYPQDFTYLIKNIAKKSGSIDWDEERVKPYLSRLLKFMEHQSLPGTETSRAPEKKYRVEKGFQLKLRD